MKFIISVFEDFNNKTLGDHKDKFYPPEYLYPLNFDDDFYSKYDFFKKNDSGAKVYKIYPEVSKKLFDIIYDAVIRFWYNPDKIATRVVRVSQKGTELSEEISKQILENEVNKEEFEEYFNMIKYNLL